MIDLVVVQLLDVYLIAESESPKNVGVTTFLVEDLNGIDQLVGNFKEHILVLMEFSN